MIYMYVCLKMTLVAADHEDVWTPFLDLIRKQEIAKKKKTENFENFQTKNGVNTHYE